MPCSITLNQGFTICADWNGITCSQIAFLSSRKLAEKLVVVVTTIFLVRDFDIVATTGPWIPLAAKAKLNALRS